jgi:hypothetical protein
VKELEMSHWSDKLPNRACEDAVRWCETQPNIKAAWNDCKRGDWMLWLLAQGIKRGDTRHRKVVLACCKCVRLALKYVPKGEKRPLKAIQLTEKWARGDNSSITLSNLRAAAADAAAAYAAAYAADAAAAYAAYAAAYAAAAAAAYAANAAADKKQAHIKMCNMIREKINPTC